MIDNGLSKDEFIRVHNIKTEIKAEVQTKFEHVITKYELQKRGQIHAHLLVWLSKGPEIDRNKLQELFNNENLINAFNDYLPKPHTTVDLQAISECLISTSGQHPDIRRQKEIIKYQTHIHRADCRNVDEEICTLGFPKMPSAVTYLENDYATYFDDLKMI